MTLRPWVGLLILTLVGAGTRSARADDAARALAQFTSEARLLRDVAGAAPAAVRLELLAAFQDRVLADASRFAGWSAEHKSQFFSVYAQVWQALRGRDDAAKLEAKEREGLDRKHAEIRQALGQVSGPDVLKTMADRLERGEKMPSVLAYGVAQLEAMSFQGDLRSSDSPAVRRIYREAASWVGGWPSGRGTEAFAADLDLLRRFGLRVPPPATTLDKALLALAERAADACLSADAGRYEAYRRFNALIDAIRASGRVQAPGRLDAAVKLRFCFVSRAVARDGLSMAFVAAKDVGARGDVVGVEGAALEAVQYFDPNKRDWIQPEIPVETGERDERLFYLLPGRTFRLRYRLKTNASGEGVPTAAWVVHTEHAEPNEGVQILLPTAAVRNCFYHLTGTRRAYWVSNRCWSQADALKRMKAHDDRLGDEGRDRARRAFFVLWQAAGGTPAELNPASLKELFAKIAYDRSFEKKPFLLDQAFPREVREALIELFLVQDNILNVSGHGGEHLPSRQLAQELLRRRVLGSQGVKGLVDSSCEKSAAGREDTGRTVGILTAIAMEKKGKDR